MIKKPQNIKIDEQNKENVDANDTSTKIEIDKGKIVKKGSSFFIKAREALAAGADAVEKAGIIIADKASDIFRDRNAVKRQQLFYGIVNLYNNGLEEFMNM